MYLESLSLFCIQKFQELGDLFNESFKARKNLSYTDVLRMQTYQILSLKLHFAILCRKKVFSINPIFSGECFTKLKTVAKNVCTDEKNNEKLICIPLFVATIDLLIVFWSASIQHILNDESKSSSSISERRRSKSIFSNVDKIIPLDKQIVNSNYITFLSTFLINYLGHKKISDSNFYIQNLDFVVYF